MDCACHPKSAETSHYQVALNRLGGRCLETPAELAKSVVVAQDFVVKHHLRGTYTAMAMLRAIDRLLKLEHPKNKPYCANLLDEFLAGVAVLQGVKADPSG